MRSPRFTESLLESLEVPLTLGRLISRFMAMSVRVLQEADTQLGLGELSVKDKGERAGGAWAQDGVAIRHRSPSAWEP